MQSWRVVDEIHDNERYSTDRTHFPPNDLDHHRLPSQEIKGKRRAIVGFMTSVRLAVGFVRAVSPELRDESRSFGD